MVVGHERLSESWCERRTGEGSQPFTKPGTGSLSNGSLFDRRTQPGTVAADRRRYRVCKCTVPVPACSLNTELRDRGPALTVRTCESALSGATPKKRF